jgi:hypothetical protein
VKETKPAVTSGPDAWVFDDAEDPKREKGVWGAGARYVRQDKGHVIAVRFADGKEEDWGEYGRQRIVSTAPPKKNYDIRPYRYVAFRAKADRDMEVVVMLITKPETLPRTDESYFGFSAYEQLEAGVWKQVVLDLTKLELGAEGDKAYSVAGKPTRPEHLTSLRLVTNKKNEKAEFAIDDVVFYRTLPESPAGQVRAP